MGRPTTPDDRDASLSPGAVLDSLAAHIAILDESGVVITVNRSWRDLATANALAGAHVSEGANYLQVCDEAAAKGNETARAFGQGMDDVLAGRRAQFLQEYPCHTLDRKRWFVARVTLLASDGPPRVVVAHEDVTERKLVEEALGRSESRLRIVLDHAQAAIFLKDLDSRYLLINRRFADLFAVDEQWMIGKTDQDFLPADVANVFRLNDRMALDTGGPTEVEEVAPCADGLHTSIVIRIPLPGADGAPWAVCGIATDITERKRSEESLRQSEQRLRLALEAARMGSWDWNISTNEVICSENVEAILGLPSGSFDGTFAGFQQLIHPADRQAVDHAINRSIEGRSDYEVEFRMARPDRRICWIAAKGRVLYEDQERPAHLIGVCMDITERKRAEQEIFELNAELEARLERINALREIDLAITGSLDLPLTLGIVIDQVLTRLEVDAAGILRCSPEMPALEYVVRKGYRGQVTPDYRQRLDEGPAGRAVLDCRTQHVLRPSGLEGTTDGSSSPSEGFVAYWALPLRAKGRVKGVMEVGHRSPLIPEPEWLEFLEALARQAAIAIDSAGLFEGLHRSNLELSLAYDATIEGWSRAMDLRDHETEGHSRRVTEMTLRLARALDVSEAELVHIRRGALLHDIGKIGIPDGILLKPGPLTEEETAVMRRHPQYTLEMLAPIAFLRPALEIPYCHHEKWDGTGYPRGLKGEQIPLSARIFAAVDIWDALVSDRPYRSGWPPERVREHVRSLAGTHLDPAIVAVFLRLNPDLRSA